MPPSAVGGRGNLKFVSWASMDDVEAAIISSRDNSCSGVARGAAKKIKLQFNKPHSRHEILLSLWLKKVDFIEKYLESSFVLKWQLKSQ